MRYEGNIFRPPGEWKSYLLQCTIGCSHNACTFCGMYKDKKYRVRPLEEVLEDINMARMVYGTVETVFLCDGDAINLPTDYLLTVLEHLYRAFPKLRRVTTYAGPKSTLRKTPEELKKIREAGLQRAYLGVETGDGELLIKRGKGVNAEQMLEAGLALREAGFDLWSIILIGLAGGGDAYIRNATMTADITNKMAPNHLSAMTYMPVPGTLMYEEIQRGEFIVQTARESLLETKLLIENIELSGLHFTSNHASNYVPVKGTLKEEREKLVALLDEIIQNEDTSRMRRPDYRRL
ncbi:MAG: radical SAM protein [Oscillospiraceae bacterium]|jgi:radical SAM superfamily enzyme YgiQ (UPF0313 family)